MDNHGNKLTRAAHIKRNTAGTSNEISFSVLDAAKYALDGDEDLDIHAKDSLFASIPLFTFSQRKTAVSTPKKEQGLPLSSGDFVTVGRDEPLGVTSLGKIAVEAAPASDTGIMLGLSGRDTGGGNVFGSAGLGAQEGWSAAGIASMSDFLSSVTSWNVLDKEIAHRKAIRRRRRRMVHLLGILLVVGIVGGGGWWMYKSYETHQFHISEFDQAVQGIERANETVNPMNEDIMAFLNLPEGEVADAELVASFDELTQQLSDVEDELETAESLALSAAEGMLASTDQEAANQAVLAIHGRQDMIEAGSQIMADAIVASNAASIATEAWDLLISADALAREAALLVTDTTVDNTNASVEKKNQALGLFSQADAKFAEAAEAAEAYESVDFAAYHSYIAKRVEAMNYALASDGAFLAKNKEEFIAQNEAYNQADAEAAALAADLSDEPWSMVAEASAIATEDLRSDYTTAHAQTGSADAFLRDYLGIDSE